MLCKTIEYEDFLGNKRKDDCYFNLSEAEVVEMELSTTGGLSEMAKRIVKAKDTPSMVKIFMERFRQMENDSSKLLKSQRLLKRHQLTLNCLWNWLQIPIRQLISLMESHLATRILRRLKSRP